MSRYSLKKTKRLWKSVFTILACALLFAFFLLYYIFDSFVSLCKKQQGSKGETVFQFVYFAVISGVAAAVLYYFFFADRYRAVYLIFAILLSVLFIAAVVLFIRKIVYKRKNKTEITEIEEIIENG